uniref:hypothetical protein n=1 Tax=uncultured Marinobacter sp. TaxID=187379 RepID=UPI0025966913
FLLTSRFLSRWAAWVESLSEDELPSSSEEDGEEWRLVLPRRSFFFLAFLLDFVRADLLFLFPLFLALLARRPLVESSELDEDETLSAVLSELDGS